MDIKKILTLIESAEQPKQTLAEGRNMAKDMVMQHYTKQAIKTPVKQPVSRLNEYFKVVDNEMLNVVKEAHDAKQVEVKKIVNRVLERLDEGKKDPAPKPRNFVAKNAMKTTSGAGAHRDKKKEQKQGYEKHKNKELAENQGVTEGNYNPLDYERQEQKRMDQERAQFKRDELEAEFAGEEDYYNKVMYGAWYVRINGKIWRKDGEPVTFKGKQSARKAGQTIKNRAPEKKVEITDSATDSTIKEGDRGSDWGEPEEILSDVLRTLEREVEWPLTDVMDPTEVKELLSPIVSAVNDKLRDLDSTDSEIDIRENNQLVEKAVSKAQQRFMGMVHAAKKGEKAASPEVAKVAKGISAKAARDFAKTKHKGLPNKKVNIREEKAIDYGGTHSGRDSRGRWEISPIQSPRQWISCPDGHYITKSGERVPCSTYGPNGPSDPGYWESYFVDANGKRVEGSISPWLKSLSPEAYEEWADAYEGAGGATVGGKKQAQGSNQPQGQASNQKTSTPTTNKSEENKKLQIYLNKKYNAGLDVDGIVGPKTKAAIAKFMKENAINESVAGPKKCWPGHRKVGTQPGTGKNKGKRVNDCEKIKETASLVRVYSNVLKKSVVGHVVDLKEGMVYVNYANTKIVMGHPLSKVELLEAAAVAPAAAGIGSKLARFIPGVGLVAGGYDAYQRAKQGDYTGAALSAGAGLAGLVPGVGTAAATGLIGAQLGRDKARTGSFLPSYDEIGAAGKSGQAATAAPASSGYTIQKGDTLTKIAKANNTTVDAIMKANPQITDPNKIAAGASLNLPGQSAAPAPQKPAAQPAAPTTRQTNTTTNTNVSGTIKMGKPEGPIQYNGKTVNPGDPEYDAASQALLRSQQRLQQARQRPQQPSTAPVQQGATSKDF